MTTIPRLHQRGCTGTISLFKTNPARLEEYGNLVKIVLFRGPDEGGLAFFVLRVYVRTRIYQQLGDTARYRLYQRCFSILIAGLEINATPQQLFQRVVLQREQRSLARPASRVHIGAGLQ